MNNGNDINNITLTGRLVRDLDLKELRPGLTVGKFTVATDYVHTNKEGQQTKESCFIDVVVWNKQALRLGETLRKGSWVAVIGRLKLETWTDKKTGEERSRHVVAAESVGYDIKPTVTKDEQFSSDELPF